MMKFMLNYKAYIDLLSVVASFRTFFTFFFEK